MAIATSARNSRAGSKPAKAKSAPAAATTRTSASTAASQRQAAIERGVGINTKVGTPTTSAPKRTVAKPASSPASARYAPGSRPGVITQNKGQVYKDGKLVGDYGTGPDAEKRARTAAQGYTAPGQGGRITNILGDKGGETYRQLNMVDKGKQTGRANTGGIINAIGSRGLSTVVDKDINGNSIVAGTMTDKEASKQATEQAKVYRPSPAIYSKSAPVLRDQGAEERARTEIIARENFDVNTATAAQNYLLNEKVNEQVYGQATPTFKTGDGVISAEQKAREMSLIAKTGKDNQNVPETQDESVFTADKPVRSIVTSNEAKTFTNEQLKKLDGYQEQSNLSAEDSITNLISSDSDIADAMAAGDDATALLVERREFYGKMYEEAVSQIKQTFDDERANFKDSASQQMGQTIAMLARMGAYGTTTAGAQYVNDAQRANDAKLLAFSAEEAAAIQKAYEAYQEADFTVAEKMIAIADTTRKEIRQIKSDKLQQDIQMKQLKRLEQEDATKTLDTLVNAGYAPEDLPPGYINYLDQKQGLPYGTSERIYGVAQAAKEAAGVKAEQEQAKANIDNAKNIVGIMKDLPVGTSMTINGVDYQSINTGDVTTGTEEDSSGNVTLWSFNKDTGETKRVNLGNIGKSSGWSSQTDNNGNIVAINPNTGEMKVVYNASTGEGTGINTGGIFDAFPEDSYSPFKNANGVARTQCGEWVNDLTGIGVGDSIASKMAKTDPSIGIGEGQVPPQPGEVFVQKIGTYGHVGIVNAVTPLPDGDYMLTISESNYKKDSKGVGLITHDRQMRASQVAGFAPATFTSNKFNWGTDGGSTSSGAQLDFSKKDPTTTISIGEKASLRKEIANDSAITQYQDINGSYNKMYSLYNAVLNNPDSSPQALDNALVFTFNKLLDPGSVVREGEFARTANGQSLLATATGYLDKLASGGAGLTMDTRYEMVRAAQVLKNEAEKSYNDSVQFYIPTLQEYGLDPSQYIKGYQVGVGTVSNPDRQSYTYDDRNDPEIQEAINEGWTVFQRADGKVIITSP